MIAFDVSDTPSGSSLIVVVGMLEGAVGVNDVLAKGSGARGIILHLITSTGLYQLNKIKENLQEKKTVEGRVVKETYTEYHP